MRVQRLAGIVSVGALLLGFGEVVMSQTSQPGNVRNVVLVHGGWVDGSGWEGVYKALKKSGYAVTIVQEATTSLADDVATTKRANATVVEVKGSHAIVVSQPQAVASLIEKAAKGVQAMAR